LRFKLETAAKDPYLFERLTASIDGKIIASGYLLKSYLSNRNTV
jgi:hypothetical protein